MAYRLCVIVGLQRKPGYDVFADAEYGVDRACTRYRLDGEIRPLRELFSNESADRERRDRQLVGMHLHRCSAAGTLPREQSNFSQASSARRNCASHI